MEYLSVKETAQKWNVSVRRIQALCKQGRIEGVEKEGNAYIIPNSSKKPEDKTEPTDSLMPKDDKKDKKTE